MPTTLSEPTGLEQIGLAVADHPAVIAKLLVAHQDNYIESWFLGKHVESRLYGLRIADGNEDERTGWIISGIFSGLPTADETQASPIDPSAILFLLKTSEPLSGPDIHKLLYLYCNQVSQ